MPKTPLSVTLDEANVLWLKGRAAGRKKRSLSDTLDEIVTEARRGGRGADRPRSVVGSVDIAADDPTLDRAKEAVRALYAESIGRPILARERAESPATARKASKRKTARG